jgi:hypothetical protein
MLESGALGDVSRGQSGIAFFAHDRLDRIHQQAPRGGGFRANPSVYNHSIRSSMFRARLGHAASQNATSLTS